MTDTSSTAVLGSTRADVPSRWPSVVRVELERRHRQLLAAAAPPVLDLSIPEGRGALTGLLAGGDEAPEVPAGGYRTIVSCAGLTRFADLGAAVSTLAEVLADDGSLELVEPSWRTGNIGLVVSSLGALLPSVRGAHLNRDVVGVVRSVGLCPITIERFTMASSTWPLRPFVALRARPLPFLDVGSTR